MDTDSTESNERECIATDCNFDCDNCDIYQRLKLLSNRMERDADQRAQGRREAAEAYCNACCDPSARPDDCKCADLPIILGTASDEKTGKGEL
jgi:hypothetical protein